MHVPLSCVGGCCAAQLCGTVPHRFPRATAASRQTHWLGFRRPRRRHLHRRHRTPPAPPDPVAVWQPPRPTVTSAAFPGAVAVPFFHSSPSPFPPPPARPCPDMRLTCRAAAAGAPPPSPPSPPPASSPPLGGSAPPPRPRTARPATKSATTVRRGCEPTNGHHMPHRAEAAAPAPAPAVAGGVSGRGRGAGAP